MSAIGEAAASDMYNQDDRYLSIPPDVIAFYRPWDYVPILSSFTGTYYGSIALLQLHNAFYQYWTGKVIDATYAEKSYVREAVNNIFRGAVCQFPIVGNLALYLYDRRVGNFRISPIIMNVF